MRECRLLNNNWKFTYGDQVTATSKEIASWQDIGIPHSFGILCGIWNLLNRDFIGGGRL